MNHSVSMKKGIPEDSLLCFLWMGLHDHLDLLDTVLVYFLHDESDAISFDDFTVFRKGAKDADEISADGVEFFRFDVRSDVLIEIIQTIGA